MTRTLIISLLLQILYSTKYALVTTPINDWKNPDDFFHFFKAKLDYILYLKSINSKLLDNQVYSDRLNDLSNAYLQLNYKWDNWSISEKTNAINSLINQIFHDLTLLNLSQTELNSLRNIDEEIRSYIQQDLVRLPAIDMWLTLVYITSELTKASNYNLFLDFLAIQIWEIEHSNVLAYVKKEQSYLTVAKQWLTHAKLWWEQINAELKLTMIDDLKTKLQQAKKALN